MDCIITLLILYDNYFKSYIYRIECMIIINFRSLPKKLLHDFEPMYVHRVEVLINLYLTYNRDFQFIKKS